ncbi:MAG: DNA-packaging protein [Burkholderiales bacterium]|nr:DNA-packaging protein [Burkholderiales bacterium]
MIAAPGVHAAFQTEAQGPEPVRLLRQYRPLFQRRPRLPDGTEWRYAFLTGGRGSAKSFHVAVFLLNLTYEAGHVILFTRYTLSAADVSIIPEFREKIDLLGVEGDFHVTRSEIVNLRTGSRILFRGIKTSSGNQTAALKSIQGVTTWVLDEAEELVDEATFERIDLSIRHKTLPNRIILVLNPTTDEHFLYRMFAKEPRADTLYIHTTWEDNRHNLSASFIERAVQMRELNPARYAHIFGGAWSRELPGLLWNRAIIERCRLPVGPEEFRRVLVGVDPAVTANMESNETGIVVCGIDRHKKGYVIEDLSGRYSPNQWATLAVSAARKWGGSIVAETNQGGDLVKSTVQAVDRGVRVIDVRASRGKYARAEPIYALYEANAVFHIGEHPTLERQMVGFNPDATGSLSPDRVDALVWALTALMLKGGEVGVA